MNNIASILFAIYGQCKNMHYGAKGMNYYAIHLLADRLIDELDPLGTIDHLQEATMLGNGKEAINWNSIAKPGLIKGTDTEECLEHLLMLFDALVDCLCDKDFDCGDESFWTGVCDKVNLCKGFVIRTMKE